MLIQLLTLAVVYLGFGVIATQNARQINVFNGLNQRYGYWTGVLFWPFVRQ